MAGLGAQAPWQGAWGRAGDEAWRRPRQEPNSPLSPPPPRVPAVHPQPWSLPLAADTHPRVSRVLGFRLEPTSAPQKGQKKLFLQQGWGYCCGVSGAATAELGTDRNPTASKSKPGRHQQAWALPAPPWHPTPGPERGCGHAQPSVFSPGHLFGTESTIEHEPSRALPLAADAAEGPSRGRALQSCDTAGLGPRRLPLPLTA